jgi:hypothetical protein
LGITEEEQEDGRRDEVHQGKHLLPRLKDKDNNNNNNKINEFNHHNSNNHRQENERG